MVGVVFKAFLCKFLLDSMAEGTCTKKILVELEDDAVPVSFVSGGMWVATTKLQQKQLLLSWMSHLPILIQNEEWGGRWVNVCKNDVIPIKLYCKLYYENQLRYGYMQRLFAVR